MRIWIFISVLGALGEVDNAIYVLSYNHWFNGYDLL